MVALFLCILALWWVSGYDGQVCSVLCGNVSRSHDPFWTPLFGSVAWPDGSCDKGRCCSVLSVHSGFPLGLRVLCWWSCSSCVLVFLQEEEAACAAAIEGVHVSHLLLASLALAYVGMNAKTIWHAAAAMAAKGDRNVPETVFAIVDNCHVFVSRWTTLELQSYALGAVVSWICDVGFVLGKEPWSVPGKCKKHSSALCKEKGYDSLLQASTQALTPLDPDDFIKIKGWGWAQHRR